MNNSRQKILTILAVGGFGLYLIYQFIGKPYMASWASQGENIKKLQKQIADGRNLQKDAAKINADWRFMQTNTLPKDPNVARDTLVSEIRHWAEESGVAQNPYSVNPSQPRAEDTYISIENRVEVSGSIDQVERFLYAIAKDPLAIRVKTLNLDTKDNGQNFSLVVLLSGLIITKPDK